MIRILGGVVIAFVVTACQGPKAEVGAKASKREVVGPYKAKKTSIKTGEGAGHVGGSTVTGTGKIVEMEEECVGAGGSITEIGGEIGGSMSGGGTKKP